MVCLSWGDSDGTVSELHIQHYEEIAKSGTGLIIIEATCVDKDGRLSPDQLGIWDDSHIEGLSKLAAICKKHGSVVFIQIHHAGLKAPKEVIDLRVSSSEYKDNSTVARELSIAEINEIQDKFAAAAVRAEKAGFDGIELHGAHGYLISQFLSPIINKRNDIYGGCMENRLRFALETVKKVKNTVAKDFIICYRMGCNEPDLSDGYKIAKELEGAGVDLLHISSGIASSNLPQVPEGFNYNWIVYGGTEVKKLVNVPVIVVNEINTPERADYLINNNLADFTAIGKAQLADPHWTKHALEGAPIIKCLECKVCMWDTDGRKCPALKRGR